MLFSWVDALAFRDEQRQQDRGILAAAQDRKLVETGGETSDGREWDVGDVDGLGLPKEVVDLHVVRFVHDGRRATMKQCFGRRSSAIWSLGTTGSRAAGEGHVTWTERQLPTFTAGEGAGEHSPVVGEEGRWGSHPSSDRQQRPSQSYASRQARRGHPCISHTEPRARTAPATTTSADPAVKPHRCTLSIHRRHRQTRSTLKSV
jgi:hypothetical protein